ncbi:MAG TPA: SWIM zinc finger family protein, partial [Mycobacteriales bacterium]|nr:SWIM zinc finger family protein [Mycobacteriales bacterium]
MTPDYGKARAVEGGLRSRSARGSMGEQWWSRRFVTVLESFALGTRLTRGRAYARKGQVLSLDVAPGLVTARVQGSRVKPYAVTVGLTPFPELVWAKAEVALAEQALCSAQLLAGELPAELEDVLAAAGAPLFPERFRDLTMSCSCPDIAVPCKHLAATFYLLAESFDDDPFRILHWRGRARDELLGRLRQLRGGSSVVRPPRPLGAAAALVGVTATGGELPPLPVHPELPADLLLRQLPAPPAALGAGLAQALQAVY